MTRPSALEKHTRSKNAIVRVQITSDVRFYVMFKITHTHCGEKEKKLQQESEG